MTIEDQLVSEGLVVKRGNYYLQTGSNCYDIAERIGILCGYEVPSIPEVVKLLLGERSSFHGWDESPLLGLADSEAKLVVRTTENLRDIHVSLQHGEIEYNFGPSDKHGFPVELRIPLRKLGEG